MIFHGVIHFLCAENPKPPLALAGSTNGFAGFICRQAFRWDPILQKQRNQSKDH